VALVAAIWGTLALAVMLLWFARDLPRPEAALDAVRRPALVLQDRTGRTIARFGDLVGEPLRLAQLPPALPAAAVAVEDRRFWRHGGIDLVGVGRALLVDVAHARVVQGGSTLTQQVAKTLFLSNARTVRRKVQELLLTLWLERHFTKAEILEIWLNRVYLGSGAWGVDAAAQLYFGVSARRLSLWQSAMLAGLPRAPSRFNPRTDPEAALARTREVLAAMVATGAVTQAQSDAAAGEAAAQIGRTALAGSAGWFADWAAEEAQRLVPQGVDATLRTTLDPRLQSLAEARLAALLDGAGAKAGASEGAVVVMDAASGAVRALVGGRDFRTGSYNRAVLARRQPGSAFKPFVWLAALEHGERPADTVLDAPLRVGGWSPADFELPYRGNVTLEDALAGSLNTAAVRLELRSGGPGAVAEVAHRLGIADRLPETPSLALGTGEVSLLEMSAAYAALLNGGLAVSPGAIEGGRADNRALVVPRAAPRQAIDPDHAAQMAQMLRAVVSRGTGRAAALTGRVVAGKTGTTQDSRDAWFIGAVGGTVIGVWLGNDDDRPMRGVTGGSLPARLFREIGGAT
jgi:penicillin-binding protein 1A